MNAPQAVDPDALRVREAPYYRPLRDEIALFEAAYHNRLPVLLKGPTGCGKTRFMEAMAWTLGRPLVTVSCHDDLTAADLVGRYLVTANETVWVDGPMTRAVRMGALLYLDEIVEARKDTMVLIHPLTDHRRILPIDKLGKIIDAHPEFLLVVSYNPGYQSVLKDLKPSTRQRFVALEFGYPPRDKEAEIIAHESGVPMEVALDLAHLAERVRELKSTGLEEGVSARLLVYAGQLISRGMPARKACRSTVVLGLTDDAQTQEAIAELVASIFP